MKLIHSISSTRWKLAGKIFLSALGVFILLEATARFHYFGWSGLTSRKIGDNFQHLLRSSGDPDVFYEFKPNLDTYFKNKRFATNSHGFRDREHSLAKPPRTFRVAVVGASYVMGWGVEREEIFSTVLEDQLNRESKGTSYEFISLGLPGYSPWRSLAVVQKKALPFAPDLILFATTPYMYKKGPRPPPRAAWLPSRYFFTSYFKIFLRFRIRTWLNQSGFSTSASSMAQIGRHVEDVFSRLGETAKAAGIPVVVVILENKKNSLEIVPVIEAAARAHGLGVVDASKPFASGRLEKYCLQRFDCHPSPEAHRIFARVIHDYLTDHRLLESAQTKAPHGR